MGAFSCASAFPDGVVRACARQGARTRDGDDEKILAPGAEMVERTGTCQREHLHGGADRALRPERAQGERRSRTIRARAQVQGPERGDRGTDHGAASRAPKRWSGRPCGRNLRECSGPDGDGATARAPAGHARRKRFTP